MSFKVVERNISFFERKKERKKLSQKHEHCTKGKAHIMNFLDEENIDIIDFWK